MSRTPRFLRVTWLRPQHLGWREPLAVGLTLLILAVVMLRALPAAASQSVDEPGSRAPHLFCLLFRAACPPVTYYVAVDDPSSLPPVLTGSDWLQELPATGEQVLAVPSNPASVRPEIRSYLLDWLRSKGIKLPHWLH